MIFAIQFSYGQKETYIAIEVGPKYLIYEHTDSKSAIKTPFFRYETTQSLHLGQEIGKNFYAEAGVGYYYWGESYRIENVFGYGKSSSFAVYEFPIRLKGEVELLKNWLSLSAIAGYTYASHFTNRNKDPTIPDGEVFSFASGSLGANIDSVRTNNASFYVSDGNYSLIETGLSLGIQYDDVIQFYLSGNYKVGLSRIIETEITYRINDEPIEQTQIFSNGSYFSLKAGIRMSISRLWREEKP